MTCIDCKYYYPYQHKYDDKEYEGICRLNPPLHMSMTPRYISIKAVGWCGKIKSKLGRKAKKAKEYSKEFNEFWEAYPKKISIDVAWRSWSDTDVLLPEHYPLVIERARSFAQAVVGEARDMKYVKHPSTWLRGGDWKTKTEKKTDTKACIDCGAAYASGHKYVFENGKTVKGKYRCEKCRNILKG
jgi:hypothetical protein